MQRQTWITMALISSSWLVLGLTCQDEDDGSCIDLSSCESKIESNIICDVEIQLALSEKIPCATVAMHKEHKDGELENTWHLCQNTKSISTACGSKHAFVATYTYQAKNGTEQSIRVIDDVSLEADSHTNCEDEGCFSTPDPYVGLELAPRFDLMPDSLRP
jgi:hypothetical protein